MDGENGRTALKLSTALYIAVLAAVLIAYLGGLMIAEKI